MSDESYRAFRGKQFKTCPRCQTPHDEQRMVLDKTGELVCPGCEVASDSDDKLRRGAASSAYAAMAFGFVAGMSLLALLTGLGSGELSDIAESGRQGRAGFQMGGLAMAFLVLLIVLGVGAIVSAMRVLSRADVARLLGARASRLKVVALSGVPGAPAVIALWYVILTLHH